MNWIGWALLSAVFAAATAVFTKSGLSEIDSHLATAIRTAFVLPLACLIAGITGAYRDIGHISGRSWSFLALSGLATGLSWLCYNRALSLGPASRVAPLDKLSVVFVLLFAALFLGEPLTLRIACGAALITAGAILVATR